MSRRRKRGGRVITLSAMPAIFHPDKVDLNLESAEKVVLPASVLDDMEADKRRAGVELTFGVISTTSKRGRRRRRAKQGGNESGQPGGPLIFEVRNKAKRNFVTHCGVLEFSAPDDVVLMPNWVMSNLQLKAEDKVELRMRHLPQGQKCTLQPLHDSFVKTVRDPKLLLEHVLSRFTCISEGDVIPVSVDATRPRSGSRSRRDSSDRKNQDPSGEPDDSSVFQVKVVKISPEQKGLSMPAVAVTNCDMVTDFEEPLEKSTEKSDAALELGQELSDERRSELLLLGVETLENGATRLNLNLELDAPAEYFRVKVPTQRALHITCAGWPAECSKCTELQQELSSTNSRRTRPGRRRRPRSPTASTQGGTLPVTGGCGVEWFVHGAVGKPNAKQFWWRSVGERLVVDPTDSQWHGGWLYMAFHRYRAHSSCPLHGGTSNRLCVDLTLTEPNQRIMTPSFRGTDEGGDGEATESESTSMPSPEVKDGKQCPNCQRIITHKSYALHSMQCERHTIACLVCAEVVAVSAVREGKHVHCDQCLAAQDEEEKGDPPAALAGTCQLHVHRDNVHRRIMCECGDAVMVSKWDAHKEEKCIQRKVECQYCHLGMTAASHAEHEQYCGSKTSLCSRCKKPVPRKQMEMHLVLEHNYNPSTGEFTKVRNKSKPKTPQRKVDEFPGIEEALEASRLEKVLLESQMEEAVRRSLQPSQSSPPGGPSVQESNSPNPPATTAPSKVGAVTCSYCDQQCDDDDALMVHLEVCPVLSLL